MTSQAPGYFRIASGETVTVTMRPIACGRHLTAALAGVAKPITLSPGDPMLSFTASGVIGTQINLTIVGEFLTGDGANAHYDVRLSGSLGGGTMNGGSIVTPGIPPGHHSAVAVANYHFTIQ